jgi:hypothetical protein
MLDQLISQLVAGQGQSYLDLQSLLRLLGPLSSTGGGAFSGGAQILPAGRSSGLQGALGLTRGVGGILGIASVVGSLLGGNRTSPAVIRPLPLVRYEAPQAYRDELAVSRRLGVQSVVRQDEFGRSEAGATPTTAAAPGASESSERFDSRMFLQYSDEIAQAVRQALLYSHPLHDLLSE